MATVLDDLKSQVRTLNRAEREELIRMLIASIDADAQDSSAAIAKAWDEEIARRISNADAGLGESISM